MKKMCDKKIKMNRMENKINNLIDKIGEKNINEQVIKDFAVKNLKTINRSSFYDGFRILKEVLDTKGIKYDLKEDELMEKCLYFDESKYFTKTQILDVINSLINAQDKLLIYLIFNKVLGKKFKDLLEIKVSDVAQDYSYINVNGNKILCDDIMKELVKDTIEQEVYVNTTRSRNVMYYDLNMSSEYLFKTLCNRYTNNGLEPMKRSNLSGKLTVLTKELQHGGLNVTLTATGIYQSAVMYDMFVLQTLDNIIWTIQNTKSYLDINGYNMNANELSLKYHRLYYGMNSSRN